MRLLHPPRDSDAVIALSVKDMTNVPDGSKLILTITTGDPSLDLRPLKFAWKATAQGGPQDEIQLLYTQKLVASGNGRSHIVFQESGALALPVINGISFSPSYKSGEALRQKKQKIDIFYDSLPIWTKRLEWHGDFVAVPLQPGVKNSWSASVPGTFSTLARIKGAARVTKTFPVSFDAEKAAAFQKLELEKSFAQRRATRRRHLC